MGLLKVEIFSTSLDWKESIEKEIRYIFIIVKGKRITAYGVFLKELFSEHRYVLI